MIFDRHVNPKYKYGSRHFWCKGHYVGAVGHNRKAIAEHTKNQLEEDIASDQISFKGCTDPFMGSKNTEAQKQAALAATRNSNTIDGLFNAL